MAQGEIYVEVDASAINGGIAPMAMISGNEKPAEGQEYIVVWLRWKYDSTNGEGGFTGLGWQYGLPGNQIEKTYPSEEDFREYLKNNTPKTLDTVLGNWNSEDKRTFLNAFLQKDGSNLCLTFL